MSKIYTSIFLRKDSGKIKVDICSLPCEQMSNKPADFISKVSTEKFPDFKNKFGRWLKYSKKNGEYFFQIISNEEEFSLAEKENLTFAKKYLWWKFLLQPKYKKALKAKIEKIH